MIFFKENNYAAATFLAGGGADEVYRLPFI
jgi:hypothetical protein